MAGRSYGAERCLAVAGVEMFDGAEAGSRRQLRRHPTAGRHHGIGIEMSAAVGCQMLECIEVRPRVHPLEFGPSGRPRLHRYEQRGHIGLLSPFEHRLQALWTLGVAPTGEMLDVSSVGGEQHGHGVVTLTVTGPRGAKHDYRATSMVSPDDQHRMPSVSLDLTAGRHMLARTRTWEFDTRVAQMAIHDPRSAQWAVELPPYLERLAACGYQRVRTSAIDSATAGLFKRFGFEVLNRLTLLSVGPAELGRLTATAHDRRSVHALRWGTEALRPRRKVLQALDVDRAAFGDEWALDATGWRDALAATPKHRVFVAVPPRSSVVGFAIAGVSGSDGFLQRLAVHPDHQRHGAGRSLVLATMRWAAEHGARRVVVNTKSNNDAALQLYRSVGFREQPDSLVVMELALDATAPVERWEPA
jgi:ribosomal protein S18 acetylase RimI-like enzyme